MKIQSNPLQTVPQPSAKTSRVKSKATSTEKSDDRIDRRQLHSRISQWFAQVGIAPTSSSGLPIDVAQRVSQRQHMMALRKVQNLEAILNVALSVNIEAGRPENLDTDWFFSFVQLAEDIYSSSMQDLWGKIFAVETSRPCSFSLRTLQVLKQLTHRDAKMFATAVNLSSKPKTENTPRLLVGFNQKPALWKVFTIAKTQQLNLAEFGLAYPDLLSLIDMKLIYNSELESGELSTERSSQWRCGERTFYLAPRRQGIALKYYKFTQTGAELSRLFSSKHKPAYVDALLAILTGGFEVT